MQVRYNFDRKWLAARVYVSLDGLKESWTMVSTTALEKNTELNSMEKIQVLNILRFHYQFFYWSWDNKIIELREKLYPFSSAQQP